MVHNLFEELRSYGVEELGSYGVKELGSYGVKELSQMLCRREANTLVNWFTC